METVMETNRRELVERSIAAVLVATIPSGAISGVANAQTETLAERALKVNQREVIIAGARGAFGKTVKRTFYDPFTAATGIKVVPVAVSQRERLAKLQAQFASGNKEWDMIVLPS